MGVDGALRAFFVDHDADDLDVIGGIEFFQNFFGIRRLGDGVGGDERDGIDVLKARADQGLEIVGFKFGRDLAFEALPGIARAFDKFDLF